VVLEQGRVMMQGSPEDLSTQAGNHLYFLHP
jgi:ABC-type multidrug transport system fused ATPase/permease subunit